MCFAQCAGIRDVALSPSDFYRSNPGLAVPQVIQTSTTGCSTKTTTFYTHTTYAKTNLRSTEAVITQSCLNQNHSLQLSVSMSSSLHMLQMERGTVLPGHRKSWSHSC